MTPERWLLVKRLFDAAVGREPHDRAAFLVGACGTDAALRIEIERLLAAHEQAGTFIDRSPVQRDAETGILRESLTGLVLGRYEVGPLLGTGGMGEVYAARDLELGRAVALKVCIASDANAHGRLKREAQHASRLNHPHICTIHEVDRYEDQPFIVMELVAGRQLSDLIPVEGLPPDDVVRYGGQIADALEHAHRNGVVHGDLKSANVIITDDGRAKVLDFGLARAVSLESVKEFSQSRESITDRAVAGTLSVMAPETLRGERADERSDIWAFGVLLYEMASGVRPFRGATGFELCAAILHEPPPPLPDRVPAAISHLAQRCLEKDARARCQSATDVRAALAHPQPVLVPPPLRVRKRMSRYRLAWALAGLLVLFASYRIFLRHDSVPTTAGASGRPAIAVMHFDNAGTADPDSAWLSIGVPSMLTTGLAQTRGLEVVSLRRLQQALRQNGGTSLDSLDRAQAADVARRAGAGAIVVGSIFRSGREIRIDAQIEDLASGRVVAARSVRGTDVFALVDQLSTGIREVVGFGDARGVRNVAAVSSTSLEAYRLYSEGMEAFGNARWPDAEKALKAAVAIDPSFAEAYMRLATATGAQGYRSARQHYLGLASRHAGRLDERLRLLLDVHLARDRGDFTVADRALDELIERFPDTEEAYPLALQVHRTEVDSPRPNQKALAITAAGVAVLPGSTHTRNAHGYALLDAGRYKEAIEQFEAYAHLAPREPNPSDSLADAYLKMGQAAKAVELYARASTIDPSFTPAHTSRQWCLAILGRYSEIAVDDIGPPHLKAIILSRLGRYREAAEAIASAEREARSSADRMREGGLRVVAALIALGRNDSERALREIRSVGNIFAGQPNDLERRGRVATDLIAGLAHLKARRQTQVLSHFEAQRRAYNNATSLEPTWRHSLEGEIALARGDLEQASAAFVAAEPALRTGTWNLVMSLVINDLPSRDGPARVALARGDLDGAIKRYQGLLAYGSDSKWIAPLEPRYVLQIARLLEKKGDRKAALDEYRRFLGLWKGADADLPELSEARQAVERLRTAENSLRRQTMGLDAA